jgi:hypothetical protein
LRLHAATPFYEERQLPGLVFKAISDQPLSLETGVVVRTSGVSNTVVQIASMLVRRKQLVRKRF